MNNNDKIVHLKAEIFDLQVQSSTLQASIKEKLRQLNELMKQERVQTHAGTRIAMPGTNR